MNFIILDIETTGLDPKACGILEVGAVAVVDGKILHEAFHAWCWPGSMTWEYAALQMHMRSGLLEQWTSLPKDAFEFQIERPFLEWADRLLGSRKWNLAGKNVAFDMSFLSARDPRWSDWFHRRVLDPSILYTEDSDTVLPNLATCCERAGISVTSQHRATVDAEIVAELILKRI
jgi:DNA polymerase III epsilon subunit-like protein